MSCTTAGFRSMDSFLDVDEAQIDNCRRQQGGGGGGMAKIKHSVEFLHQLDMLCLSKQQWWLPFGNSCLLLYSLLERLLPSIRSWLCVSIFIQDVLADDSFLCWFESRDRVQNVTSKPLPSSVFYPAFTYRKQEAWSLQPWNFGRCMQNLQSYSAIKWGDLKMKQTYCHFKIRDWWFIEHDEDFWNSTVTTQGSYASWM